MFKSARWKLTITYCLIFFSVFWLFSFGLSAWMEQSFGEGYISTVKIKHVEQNYDSISEEDSNSILTVAGDVTMDRLRTTLLALNAGMLIIIPAASWVLTRKTLSPIEENYNKQRQFVSDASHELRTPLTILQGELDVTLQKLRKPDQYQKAMISTREEVGRLQELTYALLYIAASDSNQPLLKTEPVDLTDLITEVIHRLLPLSKKKGVAVTFVPPEKSVKVNGSAGMLKQMVTNLIDNAIKFTPKNGNVAINLSADKSNVRLTIKDSGIGMTKQETGRVFERFYRADPSRTDKGFGLGLAICKAIAEQHKGTILAESMVGSGTTVTVNLPSRQV